MRNDDERAERRERYGDARRAAETRAAGNYTSIRIPDGMKVLKPKSGRYRLSILPYVAGNGNKFVPLGTIWYERTYQTHSGVGPNNQTHCCPAANWNKRCPICEARQKMQFRPSDEETKKIINALRPKTRQLFLVIDCDKQEEGVQLFDYSHFGFGKKLDDEITNAGPDDPFDKFFHRKGGSILVCKFDEEPTGYGGKYCKCSSIHFKPRDPVSQEILNKLPCLDDLLIETSYKDLAAAFMPADTEDQPDDDSPGNPNGLTGGGPSRPAENPPDDDDAPFDDE